MAPNAFARWVWGFSRSVRLSEEDIENALDEMCRVPHPTNINDLTPVIPAASFKRISSLLEELERINKQYQNWYMRPRIYQVLRSIGRLDAMPAFLASNLCDMHLPFKVQSLPHDLSSHKQAFCVAQRHVLDNAKQMELGFSGRHLNLGTSGDNYFRSAAYLGSGSFGEVDKVLSRLSWKMYARKRFPRRNNSRQSAELFSQFAREVRTLKRLQHLHLVEIVGSYTDPNCFAFLMQPIAECNLLKFLTVAAQWNMKRAQNQIKEDNELLTPLRAFFGCLASTIAYLHREKVHHMDLKLTNILVIENTIRVTDFGTAHDWSLTGRTSTHTPMARTELYTPPELGKSPTASRNAATDMWSLGIVYLEMLSVLRGRKVEDFRKYLRLNGSKQPFVYSNPGAMFAWFDVLRSSELGEMSDNEPLFWIKDLTSESPHNRPSAEDLLSQILRSASPEIWCQRCCSDPDGEQVIDRTQYTEGNSMDLGDDSDFLHAFENEGPRYATQSPRTHNILEWQSRVGGEVPIAVPGAWSEYYEDFSMNETCVQAPHEDFEMPMEEPIRQFWSHDPDGDATEFPCDITKDWTDSSLRSGDKESIPFEQRLQEFSFLDEPAPDYRTESGELGDYEFDDHVEIYDDGFSSSSNESQVTVTPLSDGEQDQEVEGFMKNEPTPFGAEQLAPAAGNEPSDLQETGQRLLPHSLDYIQPPSENVTQLSVFDQRQEARYPTRTGFDTLKEVQSAQESDGITSPSFVPDTAETPTGSDHARDCSPNKENSAALSYPDTSASADKDVANKPGGSASINTSKTADGPSLCATGERKELAAAVDTNLHGKKTITCSKLSFGDEDTSPSTLVPSVMAQFGHDHTKDSSNRQSESDSQKSNAAKASKPGKPTGEKKRSSGAKEGPVDDQQPRLTLKNLKSLNAEQRKDESMAAKLADIAAILKPIDEPARRFGPRFDPAEYIREVVSRAESEAATSVVSVGTARKLAGAGPLVRKLDRDQDWLGNFAKSGSAGAVRGCLEKGCNPGTLASPRVGPLLWAVMGHSERHNKCVRALLDHGANPNARRGTKGKTALQLAIELEYFKGYYNLIMMLLEHGADPNATDQSGDTAMLKILLGGYDNLPEHKHDALILLIHHHADVNIGPIGTMQKPIHLAARRNDYRAVGCILEKGGKVNEKDAAGRTPLMIAVASWTSKTNNKQIGTIVQLLRYGADVNEQSGRDQNTALHSAAIFGDEDMIMALALDHNADSTIENTKGLTPLDLLVKAQKDGKISKEVFERLSPVLNKVG